MKLPTLKLRAIIGLVLIIIGVTPKSIPLAITNLLIGFVILLCYLVPLRYVVKRLLFILPFFVFSALMLIVVEGQTGLEKASLYSIRLLFVAVILAFVFYQATTVSFLKVLRQLKVPVIFVELAFFTLRFMDVFRIEIKNMSMSLRSKGFRARKIFNLQEVRVVGQVLGSMFTRAMGRSDRIYYGMASRGYNGQTVFVEAESIPIRQAVVPVLIIALLIVIQFVWKS